MKYSVSHMHLFLPQCVKLVDSDSRLEGQPACDLRAVGKKFDKGLYTTLVSTEPHIPFPEFCVELNEALWTLTFQ